jgi:hypothetical protein
MEVLNIQRQIILMSGRGTIRSLTRRLSTWALEDDYDESRMD